MPSVRHDHLAVGPEPVFLHLGDDLCGVIVARRIECRQQAPGHHIVQFPLVFAEFCGFCLLCRRDDGVVVGHLRSINGTFRYRQFTVPQGARYKLLIALRQHLHGLYHPRNHIRRQIPAVGPGIGQRLVRFIQALGNLQGLVRRESQHAVGIPLQARQVVQLGRQFMLPDRLRLDDTPFLPFDRGGNRVRLRLCFQVRIRIQLFGEPDSPVIAEVGGHRAESFRFEVFNFLPPLHEDRQRRCLHSPHAQERVVSQCKRPAGVHADQPVRLAPAAGAFIQAVVIAARTDLAEAFPDRLIRHGGDPQAVKRLFAAGFFIYIPEDQLAFPPGICRADQRVRVLVAYQLFDLAVLAFGGTDHFERDFLRQDRQRIEGPLFQALVHLVRLHQGHQVSDRPGNNILVADQASVPGCPAADHPGDIPADARLFGYHDNLSHASLPPFRFSIITHFPAFSVRPGRIVYC